MARKQTRRTISLSKAYHAKLTEFCRERNVSCSQLVELLIDMCVDDPPPFEPLSFRARVSNAQRGVPRPKRPTKLDEWWAQQKAKRAAKKAAAAQLSDRSSRV